MRTKFTYLGNGHTLKLNVDDCTGCGVCETVCPHAVLRLADGKAAIIDRARCMECGACSRNCPAGAIQVQAGVGCAAGLLAGLLGIKSACCTDACSRE